MKKLQLTKDKRKAIIIFSAFVIGIILLAGGSLSSSKDDEISEVDASKEVYYSDLIEERLEAFLKTVKGIEDVRVFVTVDGGEEYEYAQIENSGGYASDYLVIKKDNGEEAAVVRQVYPEIRGVGISCTGGDSGAIKEEITSLISAALGISSNKIEVTGYK